MPPLAPTAREVVLLAVLLILLLVVTPNLPTSAGDALTFSKAYLQSTKSSETLTPTLESQYTLQSLNPALAWGLGQVPETKVVVHVPGKSHRF